jgi:hypothetical protein
LLLRQLNIPQCRADDGIWYRGWWSRLTWSLRGEALDIRPREAIEIWQGDIEIRQGDVIEIRQSEVTETRQRGAIEIRQGIGGGRANDGQGG